MSDIKYHLNLVKFPNCVREALTIIEQIIVNRHSSVIASSLQLANEIISEFIFREQTVTNRKGKPTLTRNLTSLEELQLLEILCSYFSSSSTADSALRSAVFLCLFPTGDVSRSSIFVKLVSMVIAIRSQSVLNVSGTWLQQTGPTTEVALALAKGIVNDYLILVPDAKQYLHDLPRIAPEFTTCFLCAVTHSELYGDKKKLPPKALLETVTTWAKTSSSVCTASVNVNHVMVTPFLGLVRWSVMAPLLGDLKTPEYSQLHLALLESLVNAPKERLVSSAELTVLVQSILETPSSHSLRMRTTIIRLVQIVIVLFRKGMVSGNILGLFQEMDKLPKNELFDNFKTFRLGSVSVPLVRPPQ